MVSVTSHAWSAKHRPHIASHARGGWKERCRKPLTYILHGHTATRWTSSLPLQPTSWWGLRRSAAVIPGAGDKIHRCRGWDSRLRHLNTYTARQDIFRARVLLRFPTLRLPSKPGPILGPSLVSSRLVSSSCFVLRASCSVRWQWETGYNTARALPSLQQPSWRRPGSPRGLGKAERHGCLRFRFRLW